jgi:hypothetical protein
MCWSSGVNIRWNHSQLRHRVPSHHVFFWIRPLSCDKVPLLWVMDVPGPTLPGRRGAVLWHSPFIVGVVPGPTLPDRRGCLVTQSLYCVGYTWVNSARLTGLSCDIVPLLCEVVPGPTLPGRRGAVLWHGPFIVGGCTWANSARSTWGCLVTQSLYCGWVLYLRANSARSTWGCLVTQSLYCGCCTWANSARSTWGCLVTQSLYCGGCTWANSARSTGLSCEGRRGIVLWHSPFVVGRLYLGQLCQVDGAVLWHCPFIVPGPTLPDRRGCRTGPGGGSWGSAGHTAGPLAKKYHTLSPQSTYICRVQSCAWRLPKYWPPPPSPPSECVLPPHQSGGTHSPGGGGSIFWKTPDIEFASYSIIISLRLSP